MLPARPGKGNDFKGFRGPLEAAGNAKKCDGDH
jgi:hypothetical protein